MDDQRKIALICQLDLGGEHVALFGSRRVVVVIVEARLPHGDDLREVKQCSDSVESTARFVGVDSAVAYTPSCSSAIAAICVDCSRSQPTDTMRITPAALASAT